MVDGLLASLGLYGATLVVAFIAGMFPAFSIEAFLFGIAGWARVDDADLVGLIAIAALSHQVAKTVTYYAGAGAFELPRGRMRNRIAAARRWLDRWNRRPRLVLLLAAVVGLPPLYLLGFVARPLMGLSITTFTTLCFAGRIARYTLLVLIARLL